MVSDCSDLWQLSDKQYSPPFLSASLGSTSTTSSSQQHALTHMLFPQPQKSLQSWQWKQRCDALTSSLDGLLPFTRPPTAGEAVRGRAGCGKPLLFSACLICRKCCIRCVEKERWVASSKWAAQSERRGRCEGIRTVPHELADSALPFHSLGKGTAGEDWITRPHPQPLMRWPCHSLTLPPLYPVSTVRTCTDHLLFLSLNFPSSESGHNDAHFSGMGGWEFNELRHENMQQSQRVVKWKKVKVAQSCLTLCDPMDPWNSPGHNTGVGCLSLFQGIFPTQGSNPGLPHCRQILYQRSHREAQEYWSG